MRQEKQDVVSCAVNCYLFKVTLTRSLKTHARKSNFVDRYQDSADSLGIALTRAKPTLVLSALKKKKKKALYTCENI